MFCPKCGALLMPKPGKKQLECSCGHKSSEGIMLRDKAKETEKVEIVGGEEKTNITVDAECPKCGPVEAEHWEIQTRSSDESPTRFYKCKKCGHTWREYT
jgi:DNA-directed RNA polymerase subunit M